MKYIIIFTFLYCLASCKTTVYKYRLSNSMDDYTYDFYVFQKGDNFETYSPPFRSDLFSIDSLGVYNVESEVYPEESEIHIINISDSLILLDGDSILLGRRSIAHLMFDKSFFPIFSFSNGIRLNAYDDDFYLISTEPGGHSFQSMPFEKTYDFLAYPLYRKDILKDSLKFFDPLQVSFSSRTGLPLYQQVYLRLSTGQAVARVSCLNYKTFYKGRRAIKKILF